VTDLIASSDLPIRLVAAIRGMSYCRAAYGGLLTSTCQAPVEAGCAHCSLAQFWVPRQHRRARPPRTSTSHGGRAPIRASRGRTPECSYRARAGRPPPALKRSRPPRAMPTEFRRCCGSLLRRRSRWRRT
jgi:hypothetical protein